MRAHREDRTGSYKRVKIGSREDRIGSYHASEDRLMRGLSRSRTSVDRPALSSGLASQHRASRAIVGHKASDRLKREPRVVVILGFLALRREPRHRKRGLTREVSLKLSSLEKFTRC